MKFSLQKSIEILERTPRVLEALLEGVSADWILSNEGPETWSAFDVLGHLEYADKTIWTERTILILSDNPDKTFAPFDRFYHLDANIGKHINELLEDFRETRKRNIETIIKLEIKESDLTKTGIHPQYGEVTLSQLLSAWVAHDLNHTSQITRVMAKQYKNETGPWGNLLRILN